MGNDDLVAATLGVAEWLACETLAALINGAARSQLVLAGVSVIDKSGPNEGIRGDDGYGLTRIRLPGFLLGSEVYTSNPTDVG